jgi:hypothetical protein
MILSLLWLLSLYFSPDNHENPAPEEAVMSFGNTKFFLLLVLRHEMKDWRTFIPVRRGSLVYYASKRDPDHFRLPT